MKKASVILCIVAIFSSFGIDTGKTHYHSYYLERINSLDGELQALVQSVQNSPASLSGGNVEALKKQVAQTRLKLKSADLWLRYLEPIMYRKANGVLPVEWENEVFEKFEHPYRREGAGLYLAEVYLNDSVVSRDSLVRLLQPAVTAMVTFRADSITQELDRPGNIFLCNRLFLLNLASIYITGFESPDNNDVIPELRQLIAATNDIYLQYNASHSQMQVSDAYMTLYYSMMAFTSKQSSNFEQFDRFTFIKDYVNPLFALNQQMLVQYRVISKSYNDYTLSNTAQSIFNKQLYTAQNTKGVYSLIDDEKVLAEVREVGKKLFYDPIISGNNERSCASCHKPNQYFTDTLVATSPTFDHKGTLPRNTPSLIDVVYNHLLMLDGKHITLHAQARDVMTKDVEMGGTDKDVLEKVLSCKEYKSTFKKLLKHTPEEKEITLEHIISSITYYYSGFSNYYAPFDDAMNSNKPLAGTAISGFNVFMGKAKCGTCHYVPQFSGIPAPFVSSEFEVVGTPADTGFTRLSPDRGRYVINPAPEMDGAFRTGTVRNAAHTMPYMHNGVFSTLDELITFYENGGGAGRNLPVASQTLPRAPLQLTPNERKDLIAFVHSLSENITFDIPPAILPRSSHSKLNKRVVGGVY